MGSLQEISKKKIKKSNGNKIHKYACKTVSHYTGVLRISDLSVTKKFHHSKNLGSRTSSKYPHELPEKWL